LGRLSRLGKSRISQLAVTLSRVAAFCLLHKNIPELWLPVPLEMYVKPDRWLDRNRLVPRLHVATADTFINGASGPQKKATREKSNDSVQHIVRNPFVKGKQTSVKPKPIENNQNI